MTHRGPSPEKIARDAALARVFRGKPYQAIRARLVAWMGSCAAAHAPQAMGAHKARRQVRDAELRALQAALGRLADQVEMGACWSVLEDACGDGGQSFVQATARAMRELAEAADKARRDARDTPQAPQARPWLHDAAQLFLQALRNLDAPRPSASADDEAVLEFVQMLHDAGHELSPESAMRWIGAALVNKFALPPATGDVI
ncbi:MAG TPA: hypothetical protein PK420_08605 [Rubrivivax sp.]|nr:hypothetical protein [Rubrivivax sp.]